MEEERMTHDGRNDGELRTRRGHWARRWGATVTVVAVAVVLASCSSAPAATAPVVAAASAPVSGYDAGQAVVARKRLDTFLASFDISVEKYTTPQTVTAAYYERYNNWINAGLTVQTDRSLFSDNATTIRNLKAKFDGGITSRLFTTSEKATSLITSIDKLRRGTITNYLISQRRGDAVPYISNDEALSVKLAYTDNPDLTKATAFGVHAVVHATDNGNQNIAPYYREHNSVGQIDITRKDDINFVRDTATNTWKVDSSYLISSVDHSK